VVEGGVASDPEDPGGKGDLSRFVLADHRHQLDEDVLGDVLGLVMVVHEAVHVAKDIRRIARIEEVEAFVVTLLGPNYGSLDHLTVGGGVRALSIDGSVELRLATG